MLKIFRNKLLENLPALKVDNFRYFLIGQAVSLIGTWMQRTAQQWLVYTLTDSAFLLGLLGVFQFGPQLLFSLFAGVYVDKFPKKNILFVAQTVLLFQALILAILVWTDTVQYWHILVLATVMGFANTLDMPARQAFYIEMVGRDVLYNAVALNSTIFNLARIVGPAFSGIAITTIGISGAFFANAASFVAVLYSLSLIHIPNPVIRKHRNANVLKEIVDGLKYIRNNNALFRSTLLLLFLSTLAMNTEVVLPVFTRNILFADASVYSSLLSALGLGSLIGALFAALGNNLPTLRKIYIYAFMIAIILISSGFVHSYYAMLASMICLGLFNISFITSVNSTLQLNSSDEYRGRVMSVYTLCLMGATPIGNFITGSIIQNFGASAGFMFCGIMLVALIFAIVKLPHKKQIS